MNKSQSEIGANRAGNHHWFPRMTNCFLCWKTFNLKNMLLQTRTRETVDCVVSHHNIGYQASWAKTPSGGKNTSGKNIFQGRHFSWTYGRNMHVHIVHAFPCHPSAFLNAAHAGTGPRDALGAKIFQDPSRRLQGLRHLSDLSDLSDSSDSSDSSDRLNPDERIFLKRGSVTASNGVAMGSR